MRRSEVPSWCPSERHQLSGAGSVFVNCLLLHRNWAIWPARSTAELDHQSGHSESPASRRPFANLSKWWLGKTRIGVRHLALEFRGGGHSVHGTYELDKHAIPQQLDDTPA